MKTRKEQIEYILEHCPETRNCDVTLTVKVWEVYFKDKVDKLDEYLAKLYQIQDTTYTPLQILTGFMKSVPNEDDCKRIRAVIQNEEGKFLPTNPEVIKQRKIKQLNKEYLG